MDEIDDFLKREQQILGQDALLFQQNDQAQSLVSDNLGVLSLSEDSPLQAAQAPQVAPISQVGQGGQPAQLGNVSGGLDHVSANFQNIQMSDVEGLDAHIPTQAAQATAIDQLPQPLIEWKERFQQLVAERDLLEQSKHQQTLQQAQTQLAKFYAEYQDKKEKLMSKSAKQEEPVQGNVWESVFSKIDTKKERKEMARFRGLLKSLCKDKSAPGIAG